ncbi:MAG: hypothetical protein DRO18_00175 [Thermoprotei archaeon]|nr:MAG: hypothetical protein DRO18_00175 [Thermoprotei archaeon]
MGTNASLKDFLRYRLRRVIVLNLLLLITLLTTLYFSLALGPVFHEPLFIIKVIEGKELNPTFITILTTQRIPRAISAILVGASLALAGLYFQTITRNPLADPYLIGVSSGALLGVSIAYRLGFTIKNTYELAMVAFLGSLIGFTMTLAISKVTGFHSLSLILGGLGISFLLNSVSLFILITSFEFHKVLIMLFGSLTAASWDLNYLMILTLLAGTAYGIAMFKGLNALMISDDEVRSLGYNPNILRFITSLFSALMASVTVACFGLIGFIGLAIPHIARLLLRGGNLITLIPTTMLVGAITLMVSDLVSRTAFPPHEIPLNTITGLLGSPILIYLLIKGARRGLTSY